VHTTTHTHVGIKFVRLGVGKVFGSLPEVRPFIPETSWYLEYEIKSFCSDVTISVPAGPYVYKVFAGDDSDLNHQLPTATDSYSTSLPPEAGENFCGEFLYRFSEEFPLTLSIYTGSFVLDVPSFDDIGTHTRTVEVKLRYYNIPSTQFDVTFVIEANCGVVFLDSKQSMPDIAKMHVDTETTADFSGQFSYTSDTPPQMIEQTSISYVLQSQSFLSLIADL